MPNRHKFTLAGVLQDLRDQLEAARDSGEVRDIWKHKGPDILAYLPFDVLPRRWKHGAELPDWISSDDTRAERALMDLTEEPGRPREIRRSWKAKPPPREWLVRSWIPSNRVTLLAGTGGAGKSRLAFQLAAACAAGSTEWLPGGPDLNLPGGKAARAVMVTWENEADDFSRLLHESGSLPDVGKKLTALDLAGIGGLWEPGREGSGHISTRAGWSDAAQWVKTYAERERARLLVVDPLAAAYASDENSRALVRAFMAALDGWARDAGCTVLLIAHPPKSGAAYAGSTDWHAAPRAMLTLEIMDTGTGPAKENGKKGERTPTPAPRLVAAKQSYAPRWRRLLVDRIPTLECGEDCRGCGGSMGRGAAAI